MQENNECGIWDRKNICLVPLERIEVLPLFHFMCFMINETTGKLAATLEVLGTHADLTVRRASPLAPAIAAKLDKKLAKDATLGWEPPLSGAIKL